MNTLSFNSGSAFGSRLSRRHVASLWLMGIAVSVLVGGLGYFKVAPVGRLDDLMLDRFVAHTPSGEPSRDTVVVDIDDVSLSAIGQWPWPRYRIGGMIERLALERPGAIALDILFPEADRSSLSTIRDTFQRDFGVDVPFNGVPKGLMDNDGYLGEQIARSGVVGSNYFYFDHVSPGAELRQPAISITGRTDRLALNEATGVLMNAEPIASRTTASGFVNSQIDADGALRRVPLLIQHQGVIHPHLSLAAVMRALELKSAEVDEDAHGLGIRLGPHRVPIDATGHATLRFDGPPANYTALSAVDVLNGKVSSDHVRGRIVFIGTSAVGLNDHHHTAVDPRFPGLKIQAVMAQNILDGRHVVMPAWGPAAVLAACLGVGVLMSAIFVLGSGAPVFVAGSAIVGAAVMSASLLLFLQTDLFVSAAAPLFTAGSLFVLFFMTRFGIERRRAQVAQRRLENARQVTIESMAAVAETRDPETGAHIKRTQHYVRAIALELRRAGHYTETLTEEFIQLLFLSAPLHDIGKVGVPDHILLKPGKLTVPEMEQMKQHAEFGRQIILSTAAHIEGDNFLVIAAEIAATHHEKWDGGGYPRGLAGQDIPLSGRIMAMADIYDALISRRCYKEPYPHALATTLLREMRGKTFDPAVSDAFFAIEDEIKAIAFRFQDEPQPNAEALTRALAAEASRNPVSEKTSSPD